MVSCNPCIFRYVFTMVIKLIKLTICKYKFDRYKSKIIYSIDIIQFMNKYVYNIFSIIFDLYYIKEFYRFVYIIYISCNF